MSVLKQCLYTLKHAVHTYILPLVVVYVQHIYITDRTPQCFAALHTKAIKAKHDSII